MSQAPNGVGQQTVGLSSFDDAGRVSPDVVPAEMPTVQAPQPDVPTQPEAQPEIKMVPQTDLDNLRRIEQRRASEFERKAIEAEQRAEQAAGQTWVTERAYQLYLAYLAEGQSGPEVMAAANHYALEDYEAERQTEGIVQDATRYRESVASQDRIVSLRSLRDDVVAETGLTAEELQAATQHLNPSKTPRFVEQVWKAASAAAIAKARAAGQPAQMSQTQQAQALRQGLPMPGGGTNAGGIQMGRPAGISRRDPRYKEWALRALAEQERR